MLHKRKGKEKCLFKQPSSTHNPSTTFINNLLHSKSTYFYKRWEEKKNSNNASIHKHTLLSSSYLVPSVCILALLVGLYVGINPSSINSIVNHNVEKAYADIAPSTSGGTGSEDSDTTPSLKLTLGENIQSQETIQANEVGYISNDFTIEANNINKYYITVQVASGYDSNLVGLVSKETIRGVGSNKTPANFASNTWGYNITEVGNTSEESGESSSDTSSNNIDTSTLTYNTVPDSTNATPIAYDTNTTGLLSIDYKLTFAAKLGKDKPSDHYQSQVLLSVASEPGEVVEALGFGGVTTMQELTPTLCKNIDISNGEVEGLLKDSRDDKVYWVAKLKDGNCWMTQNLDYDDPNSKKLPMQSNNGWSTGSDGSVERAYSDPGMYIYVNNGSGRITDYKKCEAVSDLSSCSKVGWLMIPNLKTDLSLTVVRDVNFVSAQTYTGTDGVTVCSKDAGSPFGDLTADTAACRMYYYDYKPYLNEMAGVDYRHYLIGNYYDWPAAAGQTGNTTSGGVVHVDTTNGVCPNGWVLPTSGNRDNNTNKSSGSFYNLFEQYGMAGYSQVNAQLYNRPLYFVYGSYVNGGQYIATPGYTGQYWSGTLSGYKYNAYNLDFNSFLTPWDRMGGTYNVSYFFPVRCLVKSS